MREAGARTDPAIEIRFLGSGDAFGSGGRFQSCILITFGAYRLLLDCGATSLLAMGRAGVDPGEIDAVLVSHFHGDHYGGIPYLILDGQFRRRTRALTIAGPPGIAERVHAHMESVFPGSSRTRQRFEVRYVELGPDERPVGPIGASCLPVAHTPGAEGMGLRLRVGDRIVAYSGDTEWTDALIDLARGAELFICEAYSFERRIPFHLDHGTLSEHRDALEVERIVLTHLGPEMLARRGDVGDEIADDGMVLRL